MLEMALDLGGPLLPFLGLGFIPGNCSLTLATESWKWEKLFLCFQKASALWKQISVRKVKTRITLKNKTASLQARVLDHRSFSVTLGLCVQAPHGFGKTQAV